jgi:L-2,4-diaminobutyrate decarboxylase
MTDFKKVYDAEDFRQQGHELVDILADYLHNATKADNNFPTIPYLSPEKALDFWQKDFEQAPLGNSNTLFQEVLKKSMHLHSPRYVGHQVTAPLPVAALAALTDAFLNNSGAVHEMGMVINPLEKIVTHWFSKHLGYTNDAYGIITSGGTLANLTALLTARACKAPEEVWSQGTKSRLAIMVSEQAHYCVDRAARIMGLGDEGILKVPTNERFQMKTECLESLLEEAKNKGLHVFAVIGSACTTSTGSYDNLEAIADFAEKHQLWMHVDGAHGGVVALSEKYKYLLKGVHRADSVIVDFHKMLLIPSLTTGVFYKNTEDSYRTFAQKASYLFATQDEDWFNSGKRTFECTKPALVLRIYAVLRTYSESIFTDTVDILYDLGKTFAKMIHAHPNFELAVTPETNIVCFRYIAAPETELNDLNRIIRQKMIEKGHFYLVSTILQGKIYLRVSLMNPLTDKKVLEELLECIVEQAINEI